MVVNRDDWFQWVFGVGVDVGSINMLVECDCGELEKRGRLVTQCCRGALGPKCCGDDKKLWEILTH